ncbi:MAG: peptidyl-prolyl cis-trans isomerase A [SAR86 cluster bacterium]|uniref:Peptidyl-prolyl cis-trans isomerase n=1 Tax=SAR86 cluster bacterium TaxID=2030880 RepID=A0A2A5BBS0_9GAMM|nr:MAG: peptidyl-prolyl cis-trans isomerase A [SAR86 cluster bacterium]
MRTLLFAILLTLGTNTIAQDNPVVVLETNKGAITIELWADKAPISVENFLRYTDNGYFDGLIFHRVIPGFMVQGGGFTPDLVQKTTFDAIKNEASSAVPNSRGTLAMARTGIIDSATSQFFINLADNAFLNHTDETTRGFGYAVFGEVIDGMNIVDEIATVATGPGKGGLQNVPTEPVIIISAAQQD